MKFPWLPVLVLGCIVLGGFAVFATGPLLYGVEMDHAVSVFHKNPAELTRMATSSMTELVPLMQAVIDDQHPIVVDLQLNDPDAAQRDLTKYRLRYASLQNMVDKLDMNDGEIRSFMNSTQDQVDIFADLLTQATLSDTLKTIGERREYKNDQDMQVSVASQSAAYKNAVLMLSTRYLSGHENIMNISTKLDLDTRRYQETRVEIQKFVETMESAEVPTSDPASLRESRIRLLIEPEQVMYRDTVQVFGVATPEGVRRVVSVRIDNSSLKTTSTDLKGNYLTNFTVENIRAGDHTILAGTGNLTPAKQILRVMKVGSVTTLTVKPGHLPALGTGAHCSGSVMANHPVQNAPVKILFDGEGSIDTRTGEDGNYQVFVPLSPGNHKLQAEFSSGDYPLIPSVSKEVAIVVPPPPLRLPDISSSNPLFASGIVALVLLGAGSAGFWYFRRSKRAPPADTESFTEPADALRIREKLEEILKETERDFPPAGSEQEAELYHAINTLLGQYERCLREQGLSEAARQVYLTLAERIATRFHFPAYRTLTAREMSKICNAENYAGIFYRFVGIYETIRYGGSKSEKDRKEFEEELLKADTEIRSDQH